MSSDTIRGEIDGYVADLTQIKERIASYRPSLTDNTLLLAESETVIIAIDGTLQKLNVPNSEAVDLDTIVQLSDAVQSVTTSSNHLLQKLQNRSYH